MTSRWISRGVLISVPERALRRAWERARRTFSPETGGRYDARSQSTLFVWSAPLDVAGAHPIGAISVQWTDERSDRATIYRVAWQRGCELRVRRAVAELTGISALAEHRLDAGGQAA